MTTRNTSAGIFLGAFSLLLCTSITFAQTTGSIAGRVVGPTGDSASGATIEVTSSSLQGSRTATSDASGRYRIPAIPPGTYRVHLALGGFREAEKQVNVRLDATATADFMLEPSSSEQVLVSGAPTPIDEQSTTEGTNYSSTVVDRLPVARNYADIVRSNPGVSTDAGTTQGRSLALAIYGATSAENQWIVDGVNTTNVMYGIQGKAINNEFVQEVEVKTGGYQAEYGHALGGIVNVITKSGGNDFHGDGFVYYDSSGTAASKQLIPGDSGLEQMQIVGGTRYDYGFDVGGYVLKDHVWFFGAYNRVSLNTRLSRLVASPDVPTSARFPFDATDNLYSGKVTWNASSSTTVVGSVFADPSTSAGASGADPRQRQASQPPLSLAPTTWYSSRAQGGTDFGVRVSQLLGSQAIANLQGSYHRDSDLLQASNLIQYTDNTCSGGTPENPCTYPPQPNSYSGGYGYVDGPSNHGASTRRQVDGSATFFALSHEIKFGGSYSNGKTDATSYPSGGQLVWIQNEFGRTYYFHQFYAVSLDDPTPVPFSYFQAQVLDYGAFVQDSWKPAANLTVNAGLRWDGQETRDYAGKPVLRLNAGWQPRVGVTWDPWSNGATKIYAFAGLFDYALPTDAAAFSFTATTIYRTYNFDPVSTVQDPNAPYPMTLIYNSSPGNPVDSGIRGTSQEEFTIGVERLVTPSLTVGLKGTYRNLLSALEDRCDFKATTPQTNYNKCAFINPGSTAAFASGDAPVCDGLIDAPGGEQCSAKGPASPKALRTFRGLELLARQAIGNSLWVQASYVYSSLTGNYDGGVNQVTGFTAPGVTQSFDYPELWHNANGTLTLDRPNHFRLDGYWVTPWRLSLGLQAFAESGAPLNKIGFFNSNYGSQIFLVPQGSAGRLPTLWGANLTLAYPITIGPATVTLQGYLLNVFNKQIAVSRDDAWTVGPPTGYPATIYDPNQPQNNPDYGNITARSEPRVFRAAVKVTF